MKRSPSRTSAASLPHHPEVIPPRRTARHRGGNCQRLRASAARSGDAGIRPRVRCEICRHRASPSPREPWRWRGYRSPCCRTVARLHCPGGCRGDDAQRLPPGSSDCIPGPSTPPPPTGSGALSAAIYQRSMWLRVGAKMAAKCAPLPSARGRHRFAHHRGQRIRERIPIAHRAVPIAGARHPGQFLHRIRQHILPVDNNSVRPRHRRPGTVPPYRDRPLPPPARREPRHRPHARKTPAPPRVPHIPKHNRVYRISSIHA